MTTRSTFGRAKLLSPIVIAALAAAIFIGDLYTNYEINVSVLYVGIVLFAAASFSRRTVLLVSIGCALLTVLALLSSPGGEIRIGIINDGLSIGANALTTFLVLRGLSTSALLRERAQLVELSHDAIISRDMNNVISYLNPAAEQLYGWKLEEIAGKIAHEVLITEFPAPRESIYAEFLEEGRWEGELVRDTRDGRKVVVESHWSLLRDRHGQPLAILETDNDVTERRRAQESLEEAQSELARFNRIMLMGEMTASISHEINQPISGAVTNASAAMHWLAADPPNIEKVRSSLERIIKDAHRASDVIGRVRQLAKKRPPQKETIDLNEVVKEVLALTDRDLHGNFVRVSTRFESGLPPVQADRIQIQQVMLNLISNAIEAMNGVATNDRELLVRTGRESADVVVEVSDTGPGLEGVQTDRLFQSFYTTKDSGMGMGLSLSRSIVEAHGGRLSAGPNGPRGACFQFSLPTEVLTLDQKA